MDRTARAFDVIIVGGGSAGAVLARRPMQDAFVDAVLANGLRFVADFDGAEVDGVGPYPMNIVNGVRMNTGMTY